MSGLAVILTIAAIGAIIWMAVHFSKAEPAAEPDPMTEAQKLAAAIERRDAAARRLETFRLEQLGPLRPQVVCPHCQEKGHVHHKAVTNKKGVSGGKATAALLTGGVSMLATGLSRKEGATEAHCSNCDSTWQF